MEERVVEDRFGVKVLQYHNWCPIKEEERIRKKKEKSVRHKHPTTDLDNQSSIQRKSNCQSSLQPMNLTPQPIV